MEVTASDARPDYLVSTPVCVLIYFWSKDIRKIAKLRIYVRNLINNIHVIDRHMIDRHAIDRNVIDTQVIDRHEIDRHEIDRHVIDRHIM